MGAHVPRLANLTCNEIEEISIISVSTINMAYKDIEKQRAFQREWKRKCNLRDRLEAVRILGGKCVGRDGECTVNDFRCLHIDHIVPILRKDKETGGRLARLVVTGKITSEEVQLLCANCHAIKTYEVDRLLFNNYY